MILKLEIIVSFVFYEGKTLFVMKKFKTHEKYYFL